MKDIIKQGSLFILMFDFELKHYKVNHIANDRAWGGTKR